MRKLRLPREWCILGYMRAAAFCTFLVAALIATTVSASETSTSGSFLNEEAFLSEMKLSEVPGFQLEEKNENAWRDTSLKAFPTTLGKNFVGLFSRGNIVPFAAGVFASSLSRSFDQDLRSYFGKKDPWGDVNHVGQFLGGAPFVAGATGALFVASRFSESSRFRGLAYSMAQGYVMNNVITVGIKYTADRTRPDGTNDLSFLSGHTSNAFTFATVLNHYYGRKLGIAAYMGAAFVAATRVGKNVHYLSDVVAGATLGYIVGRTVVRGESYDSQRILWAPTVSPSGKGVGLSATIRF